MIIKGSRIQEVNGRKPYPVAGNEIELKHMVVRVTTPDNPFNPHKHEDKEFWYIIDGEGILSLNRKDEKVEKGDLIILLPNIEHGLRTESKIKWMCLG
jgi:quercetin dioxygenase-like cupin family protein